MFLQKTLKFDCNLLVEKIVLMNYFNGLALHLNTLHCSLYLNEFKYRNIFRLCRKYFDNLFPVTFAVIGKS